MRVGFEKSWFGWGEQWEIAGGEERWIIKGIRSGKVKSGNSEVYVMDLQRDGGYWFKEGNE